MKDLKNDNRGMIIVFAVMLLAIFLSTALGFSYFIIADINKAAAIDDSIVAYYAADAGLEESLYLLKKQEAAASLAELKKIRPSGGELAGAGANWSIVDSADFERNVLRQRLYDGQSVKFFILNRANTPDSNQTKSVVLKWFKGGANTPKLQVNLTQLSPQRDDKSGAWVYFTDASEVELSDTDPRCFDLQDLSLGGVPLPAVDYLMELKVLGGPGDFVERLSVDAYNDYCDAWQSADLNQEGITSLTLKSTGSHGRAVQTIVAHILPKNPVSGLFSFVLFSEQDVVKDY